MYRILNYKFLLVSLSIIGLVLFQSCKGDVLETDDELIPYFDLFAEEGAKRGFDVDYEASRIEGLIQNISQSNVLGQCFRNEEKPKKVIVDRDYWEEANETERQFLIFHELGHCFLNRSHFDAKKPGTDTCRSIMHSTPQACDFMLDDDNREEYLDELFQ